MLIWNFFRGLLMSLFLWANFWLLLDLWYILMKRIIVKTLISLSIIIIYRFYKRIFSWDFSLLETYFLKTWISWWYWAFAFISKVRVNFLAHSVVIKLFSALRIKFFAVIAKLLLKLWSDAFKKIWFMIMYAKYGGLWWNFICWAFRSISLISTRT